MQDSKKLINIMEESVLELIDGVLASTDCCKCDTCRMDMVAYALNHLPPRYVVRNSGALLTRFTLGREQERADLLTAIVTAVKVVSASPKH